jgi:(1->4)-alpha-D-glucan 1-alpha-D-glucosylmutase
MQTQPSFMQSPSSTYRIQLHAGFTFRDLEGIIDYLHELGISTVYASPITCAVKGSLHGYDGTNPSAINPEIGTEEDLDRLSALLKKYQMSWLQDIVPNHMAYTPDNPWLLDVLEKGEDSEFHRFFDIDWDHPDASLSHRLMAPFLGESLEDSLKKGVIRLEYSSRGFNFRVNDDPYPVKIDSYPRIKAIWRGCPEGWPEMPLKPEQAVQAVAFFNERPLLLKELLDQQSYALTDYRLASAMIDYRRFFTINTLICLRMEDKTVFSAYHEYLFSLYKRGYLQGLRVDHIDGLADPAGYIRQLKQLFGKDCYIVAEKILQADECLPGDWQLEGTTGYEFLFLVNQLMTEPEGSRKIVDFYRRLAPGAATYEDIIFTKKYDYLKKHMAGEWENLVDRLTMDRLLSEEGEELADRENIKDALGILMAAFPVYRVYPDSGPLPDASRRILGAAFSEARRQAERLFADDPEKRVLQEKAFLELEKVIQGRGDEQADRKSLPFRVRMMQFTGPLAAKGIEDTTFYTYDPLISHNEVGDNPGIGGISIEEFHYKMLQRQASWPLSMNATSTHDSKRGEDSRIRLDLLSAFPEEWAEAVTRWRRINHGLTNIVDHDAPTPNDEYFIYQSLLGGIPAELTITGGFRERFRQNLIKAFREAKTETNWDQPDEQYERHCMDFVNAILAHESPFLKDFLPFAGKIIQKASVYSLSQLLIKLTSPGIPDIYQGTELWDLSFVDPDNRRPVNYDHRKYLLKELMTNEGKGIPALLGFLDAQKGSGAEKLFVVRKTLEYRRKHPLLFTQGAYLPLRTDPHWLAYMRRHEDDWLLVIVPLIRKEWDNVKNIGILSLDLPGDAPVRWKNEFTGQVFREAGMPMTAEIFTGFPVTLLSGKG